MKSSEAVKSFIKNRFEKFRAKAYKDQGGKWTIGWGHLIDLKTEEWMLHATFSIAQADELFEKDLYFKAELCINTYVKIPLNQFEYDALASFIFNVGCENFHTSTLLKKMYNAAYTTKEVADEMLRWNKIEDENTGKLIESAGLTTRRKAERDMFLGLKVDLI